VQVLSAGQKYQPDAEGKPVMVQAVNLLVTPEEAELLALANTEATLQLVLRNPLDVEKVRPRGWSAPELFVGAKTSLPAPRPRVAAAPKVVPVAAPPPVPPPPTPAAITIEIIHGVKRGEQKFPAAEAS
jgi:pilus assembly protein CpaB